MLPEGGRSPVRDIEPTPGTRLEVASHPDGGEQGALLSEDGEYRYRLWRTLTDPDQATFGDDEYRTLAFVLLNPSTADATTDDNTLRRCVGFAERWGYDVVELANLFAYRTSEPNELETVDDPFGPENWHHLSEACRGADRVVVGWGAYDIASTLGLSYVARVIHLTGGEVYCLGETKEGHPRHPLYIPADRDPERWLP